MRVGGEKEFVKIGLLAGFFFLMIFIVWIITFQANWQTTLPKQEEKEVWGKIKGIFSEKENSIPQIKKALKARYEKL